jgi:hypothetical protein
MLQAQNVYRDVEAAHGLLCQTAVLFDETRALSYAIVMALARTPHERVSREEIDGLCQLAYELLNKLSRTHEVLQDARRKLVETISSSPPA